jgi:hypothetical protein
MAEEVPEMPVVVETHTMVAVAVVLVLVQAV